MKHLDDMRKKRPRIPPGDFNLIEHSFWPTDDYTRIEGLVERIQALHEQGRLQTALNEIFKALDAHPGHPEALRLAILTTGASRTTRLLAQEPISEASFSDRRLDPIFAVCSHCRKSQWIPQNCLFLDLDTERSINDPIGAQCYNCGYVVCRDCLQWHHHTMELSVMEKSCPNCHEKQLGFPVFPTGRSPAATPRLATSLVGIIVFREGPIPPDGEYIHELLESLSPDALETPGVKITAFPVLSWPDDMTGQAHAILANMEGNGKLPPGSWPSATHVPFQDKHGIRGHIVKVPQPSLDQAGIMTNEQKTAKEKVMGIPVNGLEGEVEKKEEQGFLRKLWGSLSLQVQQMSGKKRQSARPPGTISAPPSHRAPAQGFEETVYDLSELHLPREGKSFQEAIEDQKKDVGREIGVGIDSITMYMDGQELAREQVVNSPVVRSFNGRAFIVLRLDALSPVEMQQIQEATKQSRILLVPFLARCPTYPVLNLKFVIYDDLTNPYTVEGFRDICSAAIQDFLQTLLQDGSGDFYCYVGPDVTSLGSGTFSLCMPPFHSLGHPYCTQPADLEHFWQLLASAATYLKSIPAASRDFQAAVRFYLEQSS